MALSVSSQVSPLGNKIIRQTQATATPDNNIIGTSVTLYTIEIDNTANAVPVYLKLYQDTAPAIGTTAPSEIIMVPATFMKRLTYTSGFLMSALSMACVTTPGTTGITSPTNPVIVTILCI